MTAMKTDTSSTKRAILRCAISRAVAVASAALALDAVAEPDFASFRETWITDRLSIGIGVASSTLTDSERPKDVAGRRTFVGYVWKLEDAERAAFVPELKYWPIDNLRLTLTADHVSGRTRNYNLAKHSDGVAELYGPALLVEGLLPLFDNKLLLHAGGGVVYGFGDFSEVTWWKLGYASEDSWNTLGRPTVKTRQDHYRRIFVDDAFGWAVSAGCAWRPTPRFELDLSLRHVWIEPECQFGYEYSAPRGFEKHQDGEFTMNHLSVAITGSHVF